MTFAEPITYIGGTAGGSLMIDCGLHFITYSQVGLNCNVSEIVLPESVTKIRDYAIIHNTNLTKITIYGNITEIGEEAFMETSITSIDLPNSLTTIGYSAFNSCTSLTSIIIPDSVTSIENTAFKRCSITSIVLSNSLTCINEYTFSYCWLRSVTIPESVTTISNNAFIWSSSLRVVNILGDTVEIGNSAFQGRPAETTKYYVNNQSIADKLYTSFVNIREDNPNKQIYFKNGEDY